MSIIPVNGFILIKQKEKNMEGKIVYQWEKYVCENEFEVISISEDIPYDSVPSQYLRSVKDISIWCTIIKWPHSGDKINVDDEEFWIIRPEHILAIKTK